MGTGSGVEGVISSRVIGVIIGVMAVLILIILILRVLSRRGLSRARVVLIIRRDGRGRFPVLPEGWG